MSNIVPIIGGAGGGSTAVTPISITGTPPAATKGVPYIFTPTITNATGNVRAQLQGGLPNGLSLNSSTGVVSGIPVTEQTVTNWGITVRDDFGVAFLPGLSLTVGSGSVQPLSVITGGQSTASYIFTYAEADFNLAMNAVLIPPTGRLAQGATPGTFLRKSTAGGATNYWVNDDDLANLQVGSIMQTCLDKIASEIAAGRKVGAFLFAGHESEAGQVNTSAKRTSYTTCQKWVYDRVRAAVADAGQTAPPIISTVLGRRGDNPYDNNEGVQFIKGFQRQFTVDYPWIFNMPEVHDIQTDGGAHLITPNLGANGWVQAAPRYGRKTAKVMGATVAGGVDGPRITGAVRQASSADVLVTIAHDGGTDFTPTTDIQPFRYLVDGVLATVSAAVRVNATTVKVTLGAVPASGGVERLQYGYGAMTGTDYTKALKDNQTVPLPLRWYDDLVTVQGGATQQELVDVWSTPLFHLRARDLSSGQNLPNRVVSPADGSSKATYDAYMGTTTGTDAGDMVFTPAASGKPTLLVADGTGDSIQQVQTNFTRDLFFDKSWSLALVYDTAGPASSYRLLAIGGDNAATQGGQIRCVAADNTTRLVTSNGTTSVTANMDTVTLPASGLVYEVVSYDAAAKAFKHYRNSTTPISTGTGSTLQQVQATAGRALSMFAGFTVGSGVNTIAMKVGAVTDAEVAALKAMIQTQEGITLP